MLDAGHFSWEDAADAYADAVSGLWNDGYLGVLDQRYVNVHTAKNPGGEIRGQLR